MSGIQYKPAPAIALFLVVALVACQPVTQTGTLPAWTQNLNQPAKNGARIYFTGVSERGGSVRHSGGPDFGGSMMGGESRQLTCASCHGQDGRGGTHMMNMRLMSSPDISYSALSTMPEMKGRKTPYSVEDFRKTVQDGLHPDGEEVQADMPRWKMDESDLSDLFAFVHTLSK